MSRFLYENRRSSRTLTLLHVLGVLNVLHVLHVLHMLMDASLACWALFTDKNTPAERISLRDNHKCLTIAAAIVVLVVQRNHLWLPQGLFLSAGAFFIIEKHKNRLASVIFAKMDLTITPPCIHQVPTGSCLRIRFLLSFCILQFSTAESDKLNCVINVCFHSFLHFVRSFEHCLNRFKTRISPYLCSSHEKQNIDSNSSYDGKTMNMMMPSLIMN